ncbi:tripartite motif-containing protein 16 [Xyrichtys novacula]|uniref:Tripartite motif-containing protein 16 n=1 Tax=Xyrichtys novacula TaxID=13765 RepID=A0AAV1HQF1_XYRNO|nr:tripartite motif-containing protein 16 [Xyrichtys novacula]
MRSARGLSSSRPKPKLSTAAVLCDMCKGEERAAVKSCLMCMSSYCAAHLKPHQTKKSLKQHELIGPISNLTEKICIQHKYLQEFYCRHCKIFVCWLCTNDLHKAHECVSTKAERLEKQKVLSELQSENLQRLKDREQELKDLKKVMDVMQNSTHRTHEDMEQALSELQRSVERLQELLEEILDQAGQEKISQAQEVSESLEAEIKELKRRDTEMKDLARCEDHIYYLQTCESMCSPLESGDLPPVLVNSDASFEPVREAVLDLREKIEDMCNNELGRITKQVNDTTLFTLKDCVGHKTPDVRSRETPKDRGNTNSPRLRDRLRRGERDTGRESNHRLSPRPSPTPNRRESQSLWSSQRSIQSQASSRAAPAPAPVPTPRAAQAPTHVPASPAPAPAAAPASTGGSGFSRMASISSIFRSHRRGTTPATPVATTNNTPPAGGNPFNPGLFLDSPSPSTSIQAPAFPALREISIDSIQAPEPRAREEFLQYSVNLTLDPDSAHRRLVLSEGNTKATLQSAAQPYLDTPQRFDGWTQVMSPSPLYGQRCYWEVDWRGRGSSIGVAYGALCRKGSDARSGLGYNAQSWTLELSDTCCSAMHDNENGVGVGLDFALGQFSSSTDSIKICPM